MDTGRKRSLADMLSIDDVPHSHTIAAAATRIYTYRRIQHFKTEGYRNVTEKAAHDWVMDHKEDLTESALLAEQVYKQVSLGLAKSVGCALAYLFALVEP
jgi:hypothetical protein